MRHFLMSSGLLAGAFLMIVAAFILLDDDLLWGPAELGSVPMVPQSFRTEGLPPGLHWPAWSGPCDFLP